MRVPEPTRKNGIGLIGLLVCVVSTIFVFQLILWFPESPGATGVTNMDKSVVPLANWENPNSPQPSKSPATTFGGNFDKSPGLQSNREKLIQALIKMQVFQKAEVSNGLPRLWVGPRFYALDFKLKQIYVSVYAQYVGEDSIAQRVHLYDGKSGIEIGDYFGSDGDLRIF